MQRSSKVGALAKVADNLKGNSNRNLSKRCDKTQKIGFTKGKVVQKSAMAETSVSQSTTMTLQKGSHHKGGS